MTAGTKLFPFLFFIWICTIKTGISQTPPLPKVSLADTEVRKLKSIYVKDQAIEGIDSADFLTPEQKRDIFYNNAARFFRFDQEMIDGHYKN